MAPQDDNITRTYYYKIDADGQVWHDKSLINDRSALKIFFTHLKKIKGKEYISLCQGETNYFEAEDAPVVIHKIDIQKDHIKIYWQGDLKEDLNPQTLRVGHDNILYCQVKNKTLDARFDRKTYLELTKEITYDKPTQTYNLKIGPTPYPIKGTGQLKFP